MVRNGLIWDNWPYIPFTYMCVYRIKEWRFIGNVHCKSRNVGMFCVSLWLDMYEVFEGYKERIRCETAWFVKSEVQESNQNCSNSRILTCKKGKQRIISFKKFTLFLLVIYLQLLLLLKILALNKKLH